MRSSGLTQPFGRLAAGLARDNAAGCGMAVYVADNPVRQCVGAIANARAHAIDGGSRHADRLQPCQPCDARAVLAHAGIIENQGMRTSVRAKESGDDAAVRASNQDLAPDVAQGCNAIGNRDKSEHAFSQPRRA